MHILGDQPPDQADVIGTLQNYGIPIDITSMDVDLRNVKGTDSEREQVQADIYKKMLLACLESKVCQSFSVWGIGDKYSWLEYPPSASYISLNAAPTPFDDDLNPKPAYYAMLDVLQQYAH